MTNRTTTQKVSPLIERFNMLWFIMALGFGGTSVAGFAFLNNTLERNPPMKGMLYLEVINDFAAKVGGGMTFLANYMKGHMLFFGALHIVALIGCFWLYYRWRKLYPEKYRELLNDTSRNSVLISPVLASGMAFNVSLVLGYVFVPWMRENMEMLLPIASAVYFLLWLWTLLTAIRLQAIALQKGFDVDKMHFGWLLVPFAMGMTAVTGTGIAYLAHGGLADFVFILSLVLFTMAFFLLLVKVFSLFRSHYASGLPQKIEFLPAFFIVMPIITLLTISLLRYGYYFQHKFHTKLPDAVFAMVVSTGIALMTWYLLLGLFMLRDYFKNNLFSMQYFDESQWGLICPMVAYGVLTTFVYKHALAYTATQAVALLFMLLDVVILFSMIYRQYLKLKGDIAPAD
ncbi:hypothetical protein SAMN02745165_01043 [Malonomonas rubra DSM 5091]|uniref:C4-dicarboxylate transporter/malic acid transport protein n=1 Tax=Malonomonas rubra DSM 5091 TaxID=1122189 RepID=A0A1M6EV68_MALRU|nr:hypothetical protein [Malonomonas rubra]SHI89240.1 hypothetical protein SAMN02745165_01043 [Malonomonas rubra DSM 5091]